MPTAADLRTEARSLDRTLDELRRVRTALDVDRDDPGVRGGGVPLVDWAFASATAAVDELGRLVTCLVDELHRRAALCDDYTADVQRHHDELRRWRAAVHRYRASADTGQPTPWPGPQPVPPVAPFPGAVAG